MKVCPYCGIEHLEGVLFCEDCGEANHDSVVYETMVKQPKDMRAMKKPSAAERGDTDRFGQNSSLVIYVQNKLKPIILQPVKKRIILGRADTSNAQRPDINLTPYDALKKGVSRLHVAIERSEEDTLILIDLGSANGTYLNNQRLIPNEAHVLHCSDEVRLSLLVIYCFFK